VKNNSTLKKIKLGKDLMCRDMLKTPVFCVGGRKVSVVLAHQDMPRPVKVQRENTFDWLTAVGGSMLTMVTNIRVSEKKMSIMSHHSRAF
jgi:hypothetical protein